MRKKDDCVTKNRKTSYRIVKINKNIQDSGSCDESKAAFQMATLPK